MCVPDLKLRAATEVRSWSFDYKDWVDDVDGYIEVTEWQNGEGVDVHLGRHMPGEPLGEHTQLSLSDADAAALVAALSARNVIPCRRVSEEDEVVDARKCP